MFKHTTSTIALLLISFSIITPALSGVTYSIKFYPNDFEINAFLPIYPSNAQFGNSLTMGLSLSSSETWFAADCQDFNYYCESQYGCQTLSTSGSSETPYFSLSGQNINQPIQIADSNNNTVWTASSSQIMTSNCDSYPNSIGSMSAGTIGLGTGPNSGTFNFSQFQFDFGFLSSKLIFGDDLDYTGTCTTMDANNNWESSVSSIQLATGIPILFDGTLIFDLAFPDLIGIPSTLWSSLESQLSFQGFSCQMNRTLVGGFYCTGSQGLLASYDPSMTIVVDEQPLIISSSNVLYPDFGNPNGYFLNLWLTSTSEDSDYVQVISDYEDYIILGHAYIYNYSPIFTIGSPNTIAICG